MGSIELGADNHEIIQTIKDSVRTETINVPDGHYLTRPVYLPPSVEYADTLKCSSLSAVVDYLNHKIDKDVLKDIVIHVVSPTRVLVATQLLNNTDDRFAALAAEADLPLLGIIGGFKSQSDAMIDLQTKFEQTEEMAEVLRNVGNIVLSDEVTLQDDGITQRFTVESNAERKFGEIKNPISLKPFRTFAEVAQPASPYVLRLQKNGGSLSIALFEADGGKWRNEARQNIKAYLAEEIEADVAILA